MTATGEMGDVHTWFGLSYSNYQVLHRTLLQSMPDEWQHRFVTCLEELRGAFRHVEQAPGYEVNAVEWKYVSELTDAEMKLTGVTLDWNEAQQESVYYDRDGDEIDAHVGKVAVPAHEPIPHYRRGREHVEPDLVAMHEAVADDEGAVP